MTLTHLQGGQQILTLVDFFGGGFLIFAMTIGEVVAVNWIYGKLEKVLGAAKGNRHSYS